MKIGLFADSHYSTHDVSCNTRRPSLSYKKIQEAFNAFKTEKVDFVVCLGDLIDSEENKEYDIRNLKKVAELILSFGLKFFCVMGNHDGFALNKKQFGDIVGTDIVPVHYSAEGRDFIFLDSGYFKNGKPYCGEPGDWTDSIIPRDQLEWLTAKLDNCGNETYIFMHNNIDFKTEKRHIVKNAEEIRRILSDSGKVKAVYQGHYHKGAFNSYKGINYITLKAMCEGEENSYLIVNI